MCIKLYHHIYVQMPLYVQQLEKRVTGCKPLVLMDVVWGWGGRALSLNIELDSKHEQARWTTRARV